MHGDSEKPEELGHRAAEELLRRGAAQLLTSCG
jgi:hypothetical protein